MKSLKRLLEEVINESNESSYNELTHRIGKMVERYYPEDIISLEFDDLVAGWIEYMIEYDYNTNYSLIDLINAMKQDAAKKKEAKDFLYFKEESYDPEMDIINRILFNTII